jgi:hypothetical protein
VVPHSKLLFFFFYLQESTEMRIMRKAKNDEATPFLYKTCKNDKR